VFIGRVRIEGGFAELAVANEKLVAALQSNRVSVAQISTAVSELEQAYIQAGFSLVRVLLPQQELVDGGNLRILVVDGFVEVVDVSALPSQVRGAVQQRTADLVGVRHIKQQQIERALLVAGDISGLQLRSTLARGKEEGGVALVLDGRYSPVAASVGADNRLPKSQGVWQTNATIAINSLFGFGEQIYANVNSGADLNAAVAGRSPLLIYGGGAVVPLGNDGFTANPEYTFSTTQNGQRPGVPASLGTFERFALRLRNPIIYTRQTSLWANVSIEQIDQRLDAPELGVTFNHDHYKVLRAGIEVMTQLPWGAGLHIQTMVSSGLGGRDPLDGAASVAPLSRQGAGSRFTKLTGSANLAQPLPGDFQFALIASGQYTGHVPMLLSEQMSLDRSDAVSAFPSGTFTVDEGFSVRGELSRSFSAVWDYGQATVRPYLFGAFGRGWLNKPTALEQPLLDAAALGAGIRTALSLPDHRPAMNLMLEAARGYTDVTGVRAGWRINVSASIAF